MTSQIWKTVPQSNVFTSNYSVQKNTQLQNKKIVKIYVDSALWSRILMIFLCYLIISFCCSVKAHHDRVLKAVANLVYEKTRWDVDSPSGPDIEPSPMSLLLRKRQGRWNQTGKTKGNTGTYLPSWIRDKATRVIHSIHWKEVGDVQKSIRLACSNWAKSSSRGCKHNWCSKEILFHNWPHYAQSWFIKPLGKA